MAYAPATRDIYDADSHIMELPTFLKEFADPDIRDELPEIGYSASIVTDEEVAVIMAQGGQHSAEHVAAQIALGDRLIESSKEIQALGAFNGEQRSVALDLLGFESQLVFNTFVNGRLLSGAQPLEAFVEVIEEELAASATPAS